MYLQMTHGKVNIYDILVWYLYDIDLSQTGVEVVSL